jgi:hypothetical protein
MSGYISSASLSVSRCTAIVSVMILVIVIAKCIVIFRIIHIAVICCMRRDVSKFIITSTAHKKLE